MASHRGHQTNHLHPPAGVPAFGPTDWRIGAAVALVFFVFYAGFTHGQFTNTDETGVFYVTESLYERHTLEIPVHIHAHVGANDRLYAPFAVGQSVLALPLYAAAKVARVVLPESWATALAGPRIETFSSLSPADSVRIGRVLPPGVPVVAVSLFGGTLETFFVGLFAPIVSSLLAMAIFVLLRRLDVMPHWALLTTFLIGVCSYPAMMSVYFLRHTVETVLLVFAFLQLRHFLVSGSTRALAIGCSLASMTFLVRFPAVLAGPAVGIYVAHVLWERHKSDERSWAPDLAAVTLPFLLCLAIHVAANYARWGTLVSSPMTVAGFETSTSFGKALVAFLVSPGIGIFAYSPLLILLPCTIRAAWKRWPWECAVLGVLALTELLYFANYRYWTGLWSAPGPRYLFPAGVFMLISLGAWLDRGISRRARIVLASLAVIGGVVQLILLCVRWFAVIAREEYATYDPAFLFLFLPNVSPIVASGRAIIDGFVNLWLWKLAMGWPGHAAAPLVAIGLTLLWASVSVSGAWLLWRQVQRPRP